MEKIIIYTDGGSRGNPGHSAIGVAIYNSNGDILKEYSQYLGMGTNNEAEYQPVIFALKKMKVLFGKKAGKEFAIEVRADSEFLIKQLNGEYKILNPNIQNLFLETWNLKVEFKQIRFVHIPREKNQVADKLVNQALDDFLKTKKLF